MNRKKIFIPIIILTAIIIFTIILLNPSTRYDELVISETKWETIKSGRTENNNLVLDDIEFNDYNLIIDENNNTLYYSLVNENQTKYNPNVSFKVSENNAKMAILSDKITDEKVQNNYEFKIMIYNEKEYHIYNLVCTDFPILDITYREKVGSKQKNIPVEIYLFNNLSNTGNRITKSFAKLKINEDSYVISLHLTSPGKNVRENKLSLLKMKPTSEYVLNVVNNEIENNAQRVALFINSEYKGIYSLSHYIPERENKE